MKNLSISILILGALLFSCTKKENNLTIYLIKGFRDTIQIQGMPTGINDPEIGGFKVVDSIVFFSLYPHLPYAYRAYNLNTSQKIGDLIPKGRGAGEFNFPVSLPQSPVKEKGEIMMWIRDFPIKISLVNLTKTLYTGKTAVEKEYNFVRPGKVNMLYQSNILYALGEGLFLMNLSQERSRNADNPNPGPLYIIYDYNRDKCLDTLRYKYDFGVFFYMDKASSKVAGTSPMEDIISIYDIKTKHEMILCHTEKKPEEVYKVTTPAFEVPDYAYYGCEIHNNLIMASYSKNMKMASKNQDGNYYIHIFDLSGKPLHCLVLNEHITTFSFDENTSTLYGLDYEGKMYAYPLKEIVK